MRDAHARCSSACTSRSIPDAPADSLSAGASAAPAGRARAGVRVPHPGSRRADDRADRRGGRSPVRRARELKARRHDAALRVASAAGSVPPVRSHHGAARRRVRRHVQIARRRPPATSCGRWSGRDCRARPRARARQPTSARRSRALSVDGLTRAPCFHDVSLHGRRAARSSASSGSSARAARSCSKRSSACTAPTPATIALDGAAGRRCDRRATPARAGIALVPEERQRQGLFFNLDLRHNLVLPTATRQARRARCDDGEERREAERLLDDWRIKAPGIDAPARRAERRQPAEGRRREVAGHRAARAAARRADQGRGCRRQVRDSRDHPPRRRRTGSPCSSCRAICPKCSRSPIASSSCAKAAMQGELAGDGATEEAVMRLATPRSGAGIVKRLLAACAS